MDTETETQTDRQMAEGVTASCDPGEQACGRPCALIPITPGEWGDWTPHRAGPGTRQREALRAEMRVPPEVRVQRWREVGSAGSYGVTGGWRWS